MLKKALLAALAGLLPLVGAAQAPDAYAITPEIIDNTYQRSEYFTPETLGAISAEAFLKAADRSAPVVVHSHGCYGLSLDDSALGGFYGKQGASVVMIDFLKVSGRQPSCDIRPKVGGWPEVSNPRRIQVRRAEMESQVEWLKREGFKRIYVSGHSEGGRVTQGLQADVAGVFIHVMDCKPERMEFWRPNPNNKIKVFLSSKDDWLNYPQSVIKGCATLFNRGQVEQFWTSHPTHSPLVEQEWKDVLARELAISASK